MTRSTREGGARDRTRTGTAEAEGVFQVPCVYLFHHPGKKKPVRVRMEARTGIEPMSTALQAAA